ncbi:MAG: glycoside hydrolase family 76 protein [Nitrososphaerales archaeon]
MGRNYETLWPFTSAMSAAGTFSSLPEPRSAALLERLTHGLRAYVRDRRQFDSEQPLGFESAVVPPGGDVFFDDNTWLALALVRAYELTDEQALLELASRVFDFVTTAWCSDTSWYLPGGLRWKDVPSNRSRNTCVNGPATELAALLYEKTHDERYLGWATRIYSWTHSALLGPDGIYVDQIDPGGKVATDVYSYNQGSMIGAGVLLSRATADSTYLEQAVATATSYLGRISPGSLRSKNDPMFNAVLFRNLLLLDKVRPHPDYVALGERYADLMWESNRLPTGLFSGQGSLLNNTAAMLQIYALLAGAAPHA